MDREITESLGLYVPLNPIPGIERGAGIVGRLMDASTILLLHYENISDAANIITFEDRLRHAAGRMAARYPTSKMTGAEKADVVRVGTVSNIDGLSWVITEITNKDLLEEWASGPHYVGGSPSRHLDRRMKEIR